MLSKHASEHHFFELASKRMRPEVRTTLAGIPFFLLASVFRLPSAVFIVLIYQKYSIFFFLAVVAVNLVVNCHQFGGNGCKNTWSAFSAVLIPACYVHKHRVDEMPDAGSQFLKYYCKNAVVYHIVGLLANLLTNLIVAAPGSSGLKDLFDNNFRQAPLINHLNEDFILWYPLLMLVLEALCRWTCKDVLKGQRSLPF